MTQTKALSLLQYWESLHKKFRTTLFFHFIRDLLSTANTRPIISLANLPTEPKEMHCQFIILKKRQFVQISMDKVPARMENGDIVLPILNYGCRKRWVESFMIRPPYLRGKSSFYPSNSSLGGLQSRPGCFGADKNVISSGNQPKIPRSCGVSTFAYLIQYYVWKCLSVTTGR
jgi:hypothetical protein